MLLFHFLFSYIHPFYDCNGRTNRFVGSSGLAEEFGPLPGLWLSYAIKEHIGGYYKAFSVCEHPLNKGDLTPFVIAFAKIVVEAMESMRDSLSEKEVELGRVADQLFGLLDQEKDDQMERDIAFLLAQAALFSGLGLTARELAALKEVSAPTVYDKLKKLTEKELILRRKKGRSVYFSIDLQRF